jgi:hypothetical protein
MKQITSRKLDAQAKKELAREIALRLKLEHKSNEEIAQALYAEGIGVEKEGVLTKPYAAKYVGAIVKDALREVAADRSDHGRLLQIELEQELTDLITAWRPHALGEAVDNDGNPLPMSVKAADFVRKAVSDLALLSGANEPVKVQVEVQVNNALEGFVSTLRELMSESGFDEVLKAIAHAESLNAEYYKEQKQLQSGDSDIIDADIIS